MENATGIRPMTAQDLVEIWKRRMWLILGTTALIAATTCVVVGFWPGSYRASALILIDQPAVSQDYVKPITAVDSEQEVSSLVQQALSRTLLQRLPSFKLGKDISQEDFDDLLSEVSIDILRENSDPRRPAGKPYGLKVSYRNKNPKLAQEGADELAALVVQQADQMTLQEANETTGVLRSQLAVAEQAVKERNQAMEDFKKQYVGQLPIEEQLTIETLSRMQGQLDVNGQAIERARQSISDVQAGATTPSASDNEKDSSSPEDPNVARLETDLQGLKVRLADLESRYKPNHPDVIKTREEIQQVEAQVKAQAAESVASKPSKTAKTATDLSPASVARVEDSKAELVTRLKEQSQIEQQVAQYQANLRAIPLRAQQFTELERSYEAAKKNYETLRDEVSQADQSIDVYQQHKGVRFRIQDFAPLPTTSDEPVRWKINLGGLGAGLFAGLLIAVVLELRNTSFKSGRDAEFYTGLKNLVLMPDFPSASELARTSKTRHRWVMGTAVTALVYAGLNLYLYVVRS
jgi:succinoglycan biosynthesis transport protein ExoP